VASFFGASGGARDRRILSIGGYLDFLGMTTKSSCDLACDKVCEAIRDLLTNEGEGRCAE
jgi:hypothetical protein